MQNCTNSGVFVLVHPNQIWTFLSSISQEKSSNAQKYETEVSNFFKFVICLQNFKFSFDYMC